MTEVKRILSISYDESLLMTRHMILEQKGFKVVSALGFTEALQYGKNGRFDLVIMGHSIPRKDKSALIAEIQLKGRVPVLSIRRHGDRPLEEEYSSVDALEGPQALLDAVYSGLAKFRRE